jgi:hypothetical protein
MQTFCLSHSISFDSINKRKQEKKEEEEETKMCTQQPSNETGFYSLRANVEV